MSVSTVLSPELQSLAARLGAMVGRPAADDALRLVVPRAPDERMAAVALLRLAEQSVAEFLKALEDHQLAADLVFSLGCSEIAGSWLCRRPDWLEVFEALRRIDAATIAGSIRLTLNPP